MKPEIENLRARISGMPLNKCQMALSKTEFVKLLDYVAELEQLRIHDVVGRSEQLLAFKTWEAEKCKLPWDASPEQIIEQYLSQ